MLPGDSQSREASKQTTTVTALTLVFAILIFIIVLLVENFEHEEDLKLTIRLYGRIVMDESLKVLLADDGVCLAVDNVYRHTIDIFEEDIPVLVLRIVSIE